MPLSTKPPVKVGVITDAIGSVPAARPTHGIISLRAAMARMALAATRGQTASVALRAALPRFDLNGVRAQTVTTVIVSPSSAGINIGDTTDLAAQAFDQNGSPMSATFAWASSDETVATVDSTGLVTGVAAGSATITATASGVSDSCAVTVATPAPQALFVYNAGVDPRSLLGVTVTFTGDANRTQRDVDGIPQPVAANVPRYNYYINGTPYLMIEAVARTNFLLNSTAPATQVVSLAAGTYTLWLEGTGSVAASGATDGAYGTATGIASGEWLTFTVTATQNVTFTVTAAPDRFQCENGKQPSSFIITAGAAVTRAAESLSIAGAALNIGSGASMYASYVDQGSNVIANSRVLFYGTNGSTDTFYLSDAGGGNGRTFLVHSTVNVLLLDASHPATYGASVELLGRVSAADGSVQGAASLNGGTELDSASSAAKAFGTPPTTLWVGRDSGGSGGMLAFKKIVLDQGTTKTLADMRATVGGAAPNPDFSGQVFISPTGSPTGAGTEADPIDLLTATHKTMAPDTVVNLLGGTYLGNWNFPWIGTAGHPIIVQPYNGAHVIFDSDTSPNHTIVVSGSYLWFLAAWNLEVTFTGSLVRTSLQPFSNPTDIDNRWYKTVRNQGAHNKFVNWVIHDGGDGATDQNTDTAFDSEWYGCLLYNGGWNGPDRGHGHSHYFQNDDAIFGKTIEDNVSFGFFSTQLKVAGSGQAGTWHVTVRGNASFNAGNHTPWGAQFSHHCEGGGSTGNNGIGTLEDNSFFNVADLWQPFRLGIQGDTPIKGPYSVQRNIWNGQPAFNECDNYVCKSNTFMFWPASVTPGAERLENVRIDDVGGQTTGIHTFDFNTYIAPEANIPFTITNTSDGGHLYSTLAEYQTATGWETNGVWLNQAAPTGSKIVYRPNKYNAGCGWVHCWNYDAAATLDLDLSQVGLKAGDSYEIHHCYDLFGAPIVSGTYDGTSVSVGQTGYVQPTPLGWDGAAPPTASPDFNIFLVRKVA